MDTQYDFIPIPEIYWSFETGKPIDACRLCGRDLMVPGTNYLIEKAFKKNETIFEHALCLECYSECHETMSEESRLKIQNYFADHVDIAHRQEHLLKKHGPRHDPWISSCMVKSYPLPEVDEYQLYAFCIDKDLVFSGAPYMLCGEAVEEIMDLLSAETIGVMNELSKKLFGIDAPKDLLLF